MEKEQPIHLVSEKEIIYNMIASDIPFYVFTASRVLCIDDSNKPDVIKDEDWVKRGNVYSIKDTKTNLDLITGNETDKSFLFYEVETNCDEFIGYNVERFLIIPDNAN